MEVTFPQCCGLDIHKKVVVACALTPRPDGQVAKEIRTFGTMTADLLALSDWVASKGVTHVAMESTGVYWQPIYNLLEDRFHLLLVNAQHIKAVPGRKTDVRDCEWIADLLRHGLLKASFVPDRFHRELRELTRQRTTLVEERSAVANRLQKTLEGANIKLASVASSILGKSAREILEALVAGNMDPAAMADLAKGRMRRKIPQLEQALLGSVGVHQKFLVALFLSHVDFLDAAIQQVGARIEEEMRPYADALERLDTIPGVARRSAEGMLAEIGTDMSRFPTAGHLASWAGMCPGSNESAGKRRSGRTRKGNRQVRTILVEMANAVGHTKDNYLSAQYHRLAARRGVKKAAVAVGHSILVIIHSLLRNPGTVYRDLGPHYFDERDKRAVERRLVKRLEALGNQVTIQRVPAAA
jgi:transposase